jgi:hypothetical protein
LTPALTTLKLKKRILFSFTANARKITLNVYNIINTYDSVSIGVNNILNVLISNGLKLNVNLDAYMIEQSYTVYDVNLENLLQQTLDYLDESKKDNITAQFTPVPTYLILGCVMLLYLDKLIKFHLVMIMVVMRMRRIIIIKVVKVIR